MADIHALNGDINSSGIGNIKTVFHIPVSVAKYPVDNTRESEVPNISQAELDAIRSGTLYEHVVSIPVNLNSMTGPELAAEARARYANVEAVAETRLSDMYKFYLTELNKD